MVPLSRVRSSGERSKLKKKSEKKQREEKRTRERLRGKEAPNNISEDGTLIRKVC